MNPPELEDEIQWIFGLQCPSCKMETSLFLGTADYITCSYEKCPNPDYADALAALLTQKSIEAEKRLIAWAFQAEAKSEPKFATEPLAVAHRLVERMKELDPEFAAKIDGPLNPNERTEE